MRYYKCILAVVFFSSMSLFSQEKYKKHTVIKGETISEIAQRYHIKPSAIYELNPDAVKGIKGKMVLLIPSKTQKKDTAPSSDIANNQTEKTHEVLPKETLYGITKQHHITIEELYKINPNLEKEGLKIGQSIKIPQTAYTDVVANKEVDKTTEVAKIKNTPKEEVSLKADSKAAIATEGIEYEVLPKESLYSIAQKYGIKLADLQKANPILEKKALKAGQKITVPVKENIISNAPVEKITDKKEVKKEIQTPVLTQTPVENNKSQTETIHEVMPKESLYSIARQYGIKLADLQKANAELATKSLKVGQKIIVPVQADANSSSVVEKVIEKELPKTEKEVAVSPKEVVEEKKAETEITHEVLPKETKYGIAKEYGLTVAELEKQNPNIAKKLLVGSVLKIRSSKVMEATVPVDPVVTKASDVADNKDSVTTNRDYDSTFVDQLISKASENIGTRYRSGGTTKEGFDCSGLICYTFSNYDIKLPRSSIEMASYGSKVDAQSAQKGDLIFFKTGGRRKINHVGMVVEVLDGEIKFIHSSNHGGVIISSTKESYYERCVAQINRVL